MRYLSINIVLIIIGLITLLFALGTLATAPPEEEQFSEIYLLTENTNDEFVAKDYPTNFTQGKYQNVTLGIENQEHNTIDYTLVVVEQGIKIRDDDLIVERQTELNRLTFRLSQNETKYYQFDLDQHFYQNKTRFAWLLYKNKSAPEEISIESSHYFVYVWSDDTN